MKHYIRQVSSASGLNKFSLRLCRIIPVMITCVILLISTSGCDVDRESEKFTRPEILGKYVANFNEGASEYLELKENNRYIHYYRDSLGTEDIDSSGWRLIYDIPEQQSHPRIILESLIVRYPVDVHCFSDSYRAILDTIPKGWSPYIKKINGKMYIERCPSGKQYYIKQ